MVEQRQAQRRGRVLGGVRPTGEDHRATTFELFFDLVYVFAATQVTGYMAHEHSAYGVVTPSWRARRRRAGRRPAPCRR
jgi:low temperature requirement protein LtrA